MKTSELVFVGIGGRVVALHRTTGEQVWVRPLKGSDFVNILVTGESLFATCYGEIFCLDLLTGDVLWHNRLKGFGIGLATIATTEGALQALTAALAEKHNRDRQAAASAAT